MNIREAKDQIKKTVAVYLSKDQYGDYKVPLVHQRPVFLLGAPGIGKTAIMEQIAKELNIGLVSYSMTHHTRQSALGLPLIRKKEYQGKEYDITEYTMSEIIASIYEYMEETGKKEGILFLDEINCVSETLTPSMLQFLQYKTFGKHQVPKGWIVVTAGNPPEFNRSVREFDIVTMDRMKILEIKPNYSAWRDYGVNKGLHRTVLTYLDIKKDDFYLVESTVDGKAYVTARGWEDLSEMINLYEEQDYEVDEILVGQYIRNKRIARDFATYYELYKKYRRDYQVFEILKGNWDKDTRTRAAEAPFDERVSLMGLLLNALQSQVRENIEQEQFLQSLLEILKDIKTQLLDPAFDLEPEKLLRKHMDRVTRDISRWEMAGGQTPEERKKMQYVLHTLNDYITAMQMEKPADGKAAFALIKAHYDKLVADLRAQAKDISEQMDNLFAFVETVFGAGNEMLILVTELTVNYSCARFISHYGCDAYHKYNKKFQIHERQKELLAKLQDLNLEELN
ncbi:MAG: AAA family ATPase [Clostridiales bacterium]|nr:AAA family ATPase [Clostridiales bacterium]